MQDYARFAQMLANSGELDGVRHLSPKTVDLMATNHLPRDVEFTFAQGEGYGFGVRVVIDPVAAGNLPSPGTFGWSGAASTHFIVDRDEELIALMMFQYQPRDMRPRDEFETLVYQAIVDCHVGALPRNRPPLTEPSPPPPPPRNPRRA